MKFTEGKWKVAARRPYYDNQPDGLLESDADWIRNNEGACLWFLEHASHIQECLSACEGVEGLKPGAVKSMLELLKRLSDIPPKGTRIYSTDEQQEIANIIYESRAALSKASDEGGN